VQTNASPPDPEEILAEQMVRFKFDPLGYVRWIFDWGHGELAGEDGPDEWQTQTLQAIGDSMRDADAAVRIAIASGHGIGKTCLTAWVIHWFMATRPGCAGVVTANTKDQLTNKTWRELAKWNTRALNAHWFEWSATAFRSTERPETWFIAAQPWTKERSEAFAGLHEKNVLVLFDEASAIDDVIWEVADGAMTEPGALWLALGNPTRNSGRFFQCFNRLRHRWINRQIDSRTAKRANKKEIAQWEEDYGTDSDFFRVRVRGIFPRAGSMQFIDNETVEKAMARNPQCHAYEPLIIGVDCAREGDDQSVIAFRRGRDACTIPWRKFRNITTMALAAEIARAMDDEKADAVMVDAGSFGIAIIDRLRQLHRDVIEVHFGGPASGARLFGDYSQPANHRAEIWMQMRSWLKEGAIPDDAELEAELTTIEYGYYGPSDLTIMEKKKDMKKRGLPSPDNADALACTFSAPVAARSDETALLRGDKQRQAQAEFNPYGPDV